MFRLLLALMIVVFIFVHSPLRRSEPGAEAALAAASRSGPVAAARLDPARALDAASWLAKTGALHSFQGEPDAAAPSR